MNSKWIRVIKASDVLSYTEKDKLKIRENIKKSTGIDLTNEQINELTDMLHKEELKYNKNQWWFTINEVNGIIGKYLREIRDKR